jgi:hypothetical protein
MRALESEVGEVGVAVVHASLQIGLAAGGTGGRATALYSV